MSINYTPYAHLTNPELIQEVCSKQDPTDLELELMQRLEFAENELTDLKGEKPVRTKYKEEA